MNFFHNVIAPVLDFMGDHLALTVVLAAIITIGGTITAIRFVRAGR